MNGWDSVSVSGAETTARDDSTPPVELNDAARTSPSVVYLDPRAFTRECVGGWLRRTLGGFRVRVVSKVEEIAAGAIGHDQVRAVVVNAGPERMSSATIARLVTSVGELLPEVPTVVLSDYEDVENVREAFDLGVRGYIPTSLASMAAIGVVQLVCLGGTFAPTAAILRSGEDPQRPDGEPPIEGFTQRQSQILDCLRRGMANKLIAYELNMCESTVKVHVRNIMKKLNATNRTQVAYLSHGLFQATSQHQHA